MKTGWILENGQSFYYKDDKKQTGWINDTDGRWYFADRSGIMQIGWVLDKDKYYYLEPEKTVENNKTYYKGEMRIGWIEIDSKWYYLIEESCSQKGEYKGQCVMNQTRTIDGKSYKFDNDGVWQKYTQNECYVSDEFCNMVASFEGCYLTAYVCPSGVMTIGIGTTRSECTSIGTITEEQAYEFFRQDISSVCKSVTNLCNSENVKFMQNEYEALVSFAHNCGIGSLSSSTLWMNISNGIRDSDTITENFQRWVKSSTREILPGLVKRRNAEAVLFLTGKYTMNN